MINKKEAQKLHAHHDYLGQKGGEFLSDIILGGQDGLVNTLGVILGITAASADIRVIVAGGLAGAVAEAISMGAVGYTSKLAERDYYQMHREREIKEISLIPEMEKEEIRQIYAAKGFKGELLEKVVEVITSNHDTWLETMMREELKLAEVDAKRPLEAAVSVGISALLGSMVPLAPFLFYYFVGQDLNGNRLWAVLVSLLISALTLFALGAYKARKTVGKWYRGGLQIAIIGIVSALSGYLIGSIFGVQA